MKRGRRKSCGDYQWIFSAAWEKTRIRQNKRDMSPQSSLTETPFAEWESCPQSSFLVYQKALFLKCALWWVLLFVRYLSIYINNTLNETRINRILISYALINEQRLMSSQLTKSSKHIWFLFTSSLHEY